MTVISNSIDVSRKSIPRNRIASGECTSHYEIIAITMTIRLFVATNTTRRCFCIDASTTFWMNRNQNDTNGLTYHFIMTEMNATLSTMMSMTFKLRIPTAETEREIQKWISKIQTIHIQLDWWICCIVLLPLMLFVLILLNWNFIFQIKIVKH